MFVRLNFVRPNIVSCRFIYCYFQSPITKGKAQLSLGPTGHCNPYFPFMPACHHPRYTPLAWKTSPPISFFLTRPLVEPHWHFFNPLASENDHPISLNSTGKQRDLTSLLTLIYCYWKILKWRGIKEKDCQLSKGREIYKRGLTERKKREISHSKKGGQKGWGWRSLKGEVHRGRGRVWPLKGWRKTTKRRWEKSLRKPWPKGILKASPILHPRRANSPTSPAPKKRHPDTS